MDSTKEFDRRCRALWCQACRLGVVHAGAEADVQNLAVKKKLRPLTVKQKNIGRFCSLEALVVETPDGNIALPLNTPDEILNAAGGPRKQRLRQFWGDIGWFHPAYILTREVSALVQSVRCADPTEQQNTLESQLERLYRPMHIASMLLERYPQLPALRGYLGTIRESVEVFFGGYRRAAIASLLPAVEGVLQQMLSGYRKDAETTGGALLAQVMSAECERATAHLIYHRTWVPGEYRQRSFLEEVDDYIYMLATFGDFGKNQLFAHTSDADPRRLNRHGILHGKFTDFGCAANFFRLWSILDFLAFTMTLSSNGVSVFVPDPTPKTTDLARRLESARRARL